MNKHGMKSAALAAVLALILAGCAGIPVSAELSGAPEDSGTPAPTPVKVVRTEAPRPAAEEPGEFSLVVTFNSNITTGNYFSALEKLLAAKGIKAHFFEEPWDTDAQASGGFDSNLYAQRVEKGIREEAAGGKAADGYIVQSGLATKLRTDGVTQDLAPVLKQYAPTYSSKYADLLGSAVPALPLDISRRSMDEGIALALAKDAAAKVSGIRSANELVSMLAANSGLKVYADPLTLLKAWADNQGYYSLESCGVGGLLYAKGDDKTGLPVPVENIPGFEAFTKALRARLNAGQIVTSAVDPEAKAPDGAVGEGYAVDNIRWALNGDPRQYVLFPLDCYTTLFVQVYSSELVVPSASQKAADIAKFMEWIASSTDHYMLVNYGEAGKDYRLDSGALTLLYNSQPMPTSGPAEDAPYFPNDNPGFFRDTALEPLSAALPENYVVTSGAAGSFAPPVWDIAAVRGTDDPEKLFDVKAYADLMTQRELLVTSLFVNDDGTPATESQGTARLAQLQSIAKDSAKLAAAYGAQIKKLMGK